MLSVSATATLRRLFLLACLVLSIAVAAHAQGGLTLYKQIKAFSLPGAKADVTGLVLKRDRVEMTFTGTFYFTAPIDGRVTGAVFVGQGSFHAQVTPDNFERANVKRLLGVEETIDSDFKTAVLRFSDDSMDVIGKSKSDGTATAQAQTLATEIDGRVLKETGANLSARVALSIINNETPGFFFANFDGGQRGRFSYLFDYQKRLPTDYFAINGGECGLIFKYKADVSDNEIWMAFYSLLDYGRGTASYSDLNDLVDISHYDMDVDLREPKKRLGLHTKVRMESLLPQLKAVTFTIGRSLGQDENMRLKKQMRLKTVRLGSTVIEAVQEDWESAFTVFLPAAVDPKQPFELDFDLEGDFLQQPVNFSDCSYPLSNEEWYPQQGYLDRSTFDFTFTHAKRFKVASTGTRLSETPDPADKEMVITKYTMIYPVSGETFALGPFERHPDSIKWDNGDKPIPLEFNSLSGDVLPIKETFILAELNNSVRYFQALFGKYPYDTYGAVFHPFGFGQGFATMLTIPPTDRGIYYVYAFIAHETAHQWWGNIVAWRSYRDQWLSEGFAEYSGVNYTGVRDGPKSAALLIDNMRRALVLPPETVSGIGKGRLVDVGPLILGHRLETRKTFGAYQSLVYGKGALVLRMIHYLMTDPQTGNGDAFYAMMKDFVERYRNKVASTDDFRRVAGEHFARTPIARGYNLKNLDWFFQQWVYDTTLPSYKLEYELQAQPDGSVMMVGNTIQLNAPDQFLMPLPLVFKFGPGKTAYGTVLAYGAKTPFKIKLPSRPEGVELDPDHWILSEKTSSK
jgi:Peptidase family M1 domain